MMLAPIDKIKLRECYIRPIPRRDAHLIYNVYHYSHNLPSDCYIHIGLFFKGQLIGAASFGQVAMYNSKKYLGKEGKIVELRRLACIDDTPKNTESYFISRCLKYLKINTDFDAVLSYADETYGHIGVIYKASNFEYLGTTKPDKMYIVDGKLMHRKSLYDRHGTQKFKDLKRIYGNRIKVFNTKPKHVYIYFLKKKRKKVKKQ